MTESKKPPFDAARRRFIKQAMLTGVVAAGGLAACSGGVSFLRPASDVTRWSKLLGMNPAAAAGLGASYLEIDPKQASLQSLRQSIEQAMSAHTTGEFDYKDVAAVRSAVDTVVREDYLNGNLVKVDGWLVSRTEAQLYGVFALTEDI